jgi:hypothetical protein
VFPLAILGTFVRNFFFDRFVPFFNLCIVVYLAVPVLRDSGSVLMQVIPQSVSEQINGITGELSRQLMKMQIWDD